MNESLKARLQAIRILPNSILECLNPPHISEHLLTFQLPYSSQVCSDPSKCLIFCLLRQCHPCFLLHRNALAQGKEAVLKTSNYMYGLWLGKYELCSGSMTFSSLSSGPCAGYFHLEASQWSLLRVWKASSKHKLRQVPQIPKEFPPETVCLCFAGLWSRPLCQKHWQQFGFCQLRVFTACQLRWEPGGSSLARMRAVVPRLSVCWNCFFASWNILNFSAPNSGSRLIAEQYDST